MRSVGTSDGYAGGFQQRVAGVECGEMGSQ